jgi:spore cortex biosynthesis protein YabQ
MAQIEAFSLTFILGLVAGLIFHYYQLTIRNIEIRRYSLYLLDFLLWMGMICVVSVGILLINQGEVRSYVFIALVLGVITYFRSIARYTSPSLQTIAQAGISLLRTTSRMIRGPFNRTVTWIKQVLRKRVPVDPPPPED